MDCEFGDADASEEESAAVEDDSQGTSECDEPGHCCGHCIVIHTTLYSYFGVDGNTICRVQLHERKRAGLTGPKSATNHGVLDQRTCAPDRYPPIDCATMAAGFPNDDDTPSQSLFFDFKGLGTEDIAKFYGSFTTQKMKAGYVVLFSNQGRGTVRPLGEEAPPESAFVVGPKGEMPLDRWATCFHQPVQEAAKTLETCTTGMKTLMRRLGLARWPQRQYVAIDTALCRVTNSPLPVKRRAPPNARPARPRKPARRSNALLGQQGPGSSLDALDPMLSEPPTTAAALPQFVGAAAAYAPLKYVPLPHAVRPFVPSQAFGPWDIPPQDHVPLDALPQNFAPPAFVPLDFAALGYAPVDYAPLPFGPPLFSEPGFAEGFALPAFVPDLRAPAFLQQQQQQQPFSQLYDPGPYSQLMQAAVGITAGGPTLM